VITQRVSKVEKAGHFLMREKPELVNEAIRDFVLENRG
jgi:pimeloyl-ACP methyl ester carboxylesterase